MSGLPPGWMAQQDAQGRTFYVDPQGQSHWQPPAAPPAGGSPYAAPPGNPPGADGFTNLGIQQPAAAAPTNMSAEDAQFTQQYGLQRVAAMSQFVMKQKVDLIEAVTGGMCERTNKYTIMDQQGRPAFIALEEGDCCCRMCCAPHHELLIKVHETNDGRTPGNILMTVERPFKFGCCFACMDCCRQEITVHPGNFEKGMMGDTIGRVKAPFLGGGLTPELKVMSREDRETGAEIVGPTCCIGSCCDSTFNLNNGGRNMGMIRKEGAKGAKDLATELLTDADNFTMTWNEDLDMYTKVSLLGAMFLLDFMFFEDDGNFECNPCKQTCSIKLCDLFCCGALCPVKLKCDCSDDNDDNEGGDDACCAGCFVGCCAADCLGDCCGDDCCNE